MLSRLLISGPIDETTPECVLIEICVAHGVKYDSDSINFINSMTFIKINTSLTPSSKLTLNAWKHIARFVNKFETWSIDSLVQAFNYLMSFTDDLDPLTKINSNFTVIQNHNQPLSVNACILYKICRYHHVSISLETSLEQLANLTRLLFLSRNILISKAEQSLANKTNAELITLITEQSISANISYDNLHDLQVNLSNVNFLRSQLRPILPESCIALAFLNYHLDISTAQDPILEYYNLIDSEQFLDPKLRYYQNLNPNLYNINFNFNPLFSANYYTKDQLRRLALSAGYTEQEVSHSSAYDLLQISYLTDNFYLGPHPKIFETTTSINLENANEIPNGELFGYGIITNNLRPISVEELIDTFEANQNFTSPFNSTDVFDITVIRKLKNLLTGNKGQRLINLINQLSVDDQGDHLKTLIKMFNSGDLKLKENICYALRCLLEMGMYMRGWDGIGPYVLGRIDNDELATNINSRRAIDKYEQACKDLKRLGLTINSLPLVRFRGGKYLASNDAKNGFTIGERVNIVKINDKNDIYGCIKMSSNWFTSSAHKYIVALGYKPPFDIYKLRDIA